ncbi:glycosyl hydrolase [Oceanispirochaeta crateris]|nr:glycosyl hydrolase [Oceanispirochaeta crateris]
MYSSKGFQSSELGDVDVLFYRGMYHLFHLVLPNHDYIAHAVSSDGILWRRVKNALFIGEPGEWDDDMLWTMHVSQDPDHEGIWRMFYTGIARREGGRIQRIGLARSKDLYNWEKDQSGQYPLAITGPVYEQDMEEGRTWISCRDPFFYNDEAVRMLLVSARVAEGPIIRRGCVGVAIEEKPDHFVWQKELFYPRMYDDVEVPGLYNINGIYYLIGNIKEDVKVHYWHSDSLFGEYEANTDNVLLPRGNYAGRITKSEGKYLLWSFFNSVTKGSLRRILPPPVELTADSHGKLHVSSYPGFSEKIVGHAVFEELRPFRKLLKNPAASWDQDNNTLGSRTGYEVFYSSKPVYSAIISAEIEIGGPGKTGMVLRGDEEGNGYYISLELKHGIAQARIWGMKDNDDIEHLFQYENLQRNHFRVNPSKKYRLSALCFGGYFELSIDGGLVLRFVDTTYMEKSHWGFYVESAEMKIHDLEVDILDAPQEEDHAVI